jgi:TonB-linked SusC/RagA family outer membrane protein
MKKKQTKHPLGACLYLILLKMKLTLLILFIAVIGTRAVESHAQSTRLTLKMENTSIEEVLKEIENRCEFRFFYNGIIDVDQLVSVDFKEMSVPDVLKNIFEDTQIQYKVMGRQIMLSNAESVSVMINQQARTISGRVTDTFGAALPGVTIIIKGTTSGTVTGTDGGYNLTEVPANAVLLFSFVGMRTQEVSTSGKTNVDVVMAEEAVGLDEVVAIGYGKQKKVNLTGSVANITNEQLEKRTVTRASQVLAGQLSGISVRQLSGNPGTNGASLLIRGRGTFSGTGTSPLILVDGIESSIDNVDPNDIASISILKDAASAAIYGSKAANGVILIETKMGVSGEPVFSYQTFIGKQKPTMLPEMVNSWEYAEILNEAQVNMGGSKRYTDEEIQKFKSGSDPINYPNFDHIGYLFKSGSGLETKHNLSMRGGAKGTRYLFSAGYYDQQGLIKKNGADRFDIRLNLDTELRDNLKFSVKLAGNKYKGEEPSSPYSAGLGWIVRGAMRNSNTIPGVYPDGYYGRNETLHPEADLNSKSFVKNESSYFYSNFDLLWEITKDLSIRGQAGYTYGVSDYKYFIATQQITPDYGISVNSLTNSWSKSAALTLQSVIEYSKVLNNHTFQLLGGISGQAYDYRYIAAYRNKFPNNEIYEIDAGSTAQGTQNGSGSQSSLLSYFGRANYNYRSKYLFEANFRYDGSSRFSKGNRWGLFPSFSAAWRVSEEGFFQDAVPWANNLKLRASWGKLGNQSIGDYPYQDLITLGQNYPFGNELSAGAAVTTIANKEITWETTKIIDFGLDLSFFENKLALTVDYFRKNTFDILYNVSVSRMLGAYPSSTNAGEVKNTGWDFDLSYKNSAGDFHYGVSAIFSVVHNEVVKLYGDLKDDINSGLFVGHPVGSSYGYVSDGLFATNDEVADYATQPFSVIANAGGIKFVDISGPDGSPDGKVTSAYDRRVIGQPLPITTYALTLNGDYKNFDFNILFQGEGGRKDMVNIDHFFPLDNNGNVQRDAYENRWTAENPDPHAIYPKIMITGTDFYRNNPVDYWFKNATFIRLKNIQIGYTLPKSVLRKTFLDRVRIYVTGENLFTLTSYYKDWDPEMSTGGSTRFYPLSKLYVAGVNIDF